MILFLVIFFAACTAAPTAIPATIPSTRKPVQTATLLPKYQTETWRWKPIPTGSPLPPYKTPTLVYSAPQDKTLDTICRITINSFFSYKLGDDPVAYRDLFTPSSQNRADSYTPPQEGRILLELMPASQEWYRDFPGTLMPGAIIPEAPNEYIYYVEFTSKNAAPNATPAYFPADFITMTMVADGTNSCKIENYGKG